ncbi:MAG: glycosyltransferase [Phycisphaeraceae bacterium]|nr:glycosyltransferase [Phycisphaeraceae bacterium]
MLTHRVPYPLDRGDRIRAYHILRHLSDSCDVSLAAISDEPITSAQRQALESLTHRLTVRQINSRYSQLRGGLSLLAGRSATPACLYRRDLAKTICRWHQEQPFDAVLTYCTSMVSYARRFYRWLKDRPASSGHPHSDPPRHVIDLVDVDSVKWQEYAAHARGPMRWVYAAEARRLRAVEAGRFDHFDALAVVSDAEADAYRRTVGSHPGLTTLRQAVDLDYLHPLPDHDGLDLLFVGTLNYAPNVEGICWFAQHVMPELRRRLPQVRLRIVGRHPTPRVLALGQLPGAGALPGVAPHGNAGPARQLPGALPGAFPGAGAGVEVVGPVDDVRPYLAQATAVVAPLLIARGIQCKVLEAMAAARVAVCSPGAAEGIVAQPSQHLLVAQNPQQWADCLEKVLTDKAYRTRIAQSARRQVEAIYPWSECLKPLLPLLLGPTGEPAVVKPVAA